MHTPLLLFTVAVVQVLPPPLDGGFPGAVLSLMGSLALLLNLVFDLAQQMLSGLRPEHVQRVLDGLPAKDQGPMLEMLMEAADQAAVHAEVT